MPSTEVGSKMARYGFELAEFQSHVEAKFDYFTVASPVRPIITSGVLLRSRLFVLFYSYLLTA